MKNGWKLVIGLYVAIACITLVSETSDRMSRCARPAACALSFGRGAIWSAAWPAFWIGYAYDWAVSGQAPDAAVDAEWYLSQYPDVRDAVQNGQIKSAEDHFRTYGFKEKRLPARPNFDEAFYLRTNPDVADAVQRGQYKSGFEHYLVKGYIEGRKPLP